MATNVAGAYEGVRRAIAEQRCVVLDGATATELHPPHGQENERLWSTDALSSAPEDVLAVHRSYVDAGCDVISTNTWGLAGALGEPDWMEVARRGVRLARRAVAEGGREGEVAVAFSLSGDLDGDEGREVLPLLARALASEPPDLILMETLSLVRPSLLEVVERLLDTGLPLWLSFRRCRHGLCGVYGQHWGGPEGDAFGRAARRFEEMGVGALAVNCIPPDHVGGMIGWLRDFTDMPLGVYPNLGYLTSAGWSFEDSVGGPEYAQMALQWRAEGAQIVGGCCGTGPEHIAAAREALQGTLPGHQHVEPAHAEPDGSTGSVAIAAPWADARGTRLYPLAFPSLTASEGVALPSQASLLLWKHLQRERVGEGLRCLDIGCGTGLQTVQLALNGAAHVHGIDVEPEAVAVTMANAFRNGVADRVTGATADLFAWVPDERYDVIVASLFQTPVDPFQHVASHRPLDYWGRSAVDHVIRALPAALTDDGEAYLVLLSLLSQERTVAELAERGLAAAVVDFGFMPF
ncbi:MAG TPA: homocysteine S-methyltransferase family protein, partial [Solirubrobacteraceae bacterium]|nr:homocysteine S-methyltransferase family protein [Solirubrobacteraceae bacterium]